MRPIRKKPPWPEGHIGQGQRLPRGASTEAHHQDQAGVCRRREPGQRASAQSWDLGPEEAAWSQHLYLSATCHLESLGHLEGRSRVGSVCLCPHRPVQAPCPTRGRSVNRRLIKDRRLFPLRFLGPRQLIPQATWCPPSLPGPRCLGPCWLGPCWLGPKLCASRGLRRPRGSLLHTRQLRVGENEFRNGHTKLC